MSVPASTRWTVQPVTPDAVGQRVAHGVRAREGRQQGGVGVEDALREGGEDGRAEDAA